MYWFPILSTCTETVYATRSFLLIIMFVWRGCPLIKNRAESTGWHKQSLVPLPFTGPTFFLHVLVPHSFYILSTCTGPPFFLRVLVPHSFYILSICTGPHSFHTYWFPYLSIWPVLNHSWCPFFPRGQGRVTERRILLAACQETL